MLCLFFHNSIWRKRLQIGKAFGTIYSCLQHRPCQSFRGWRDSLSKNKTKNLLACLTRIRLEFDSKNPHFKKKKSVLMEHTCQPTAGQAQTGRSWVLAGSQLSLLVEFYAFEIMYQLLSWCCGKMQKQLRGAKACGIHGFWFESSWMERLGDGGLG